MTGPGEDSEAALPVDAWWPRTDYPNQCHVWRCTCKKHVVYQPFGAPLPDELRSRQTRSEK